MKFEWLLNKIENAIEEERESRSFLTYNSLIEEALKISIKAKNSKKPIIVVKENNYMVNKLAEILNSYFEEDEIVTYLPEESMRSEEIATSFENRAYRLYALYKILTGKNVKVILISPYGYIRNLPDPTILRNSIIHIKKDEEINKEELINKLIQLGYEKSNYVETPMTYATRGYIVDVFSVNYDNPIRIEFFDDVVDSIRTFDVNTQRTVKNIDNVDIIFAKDVFFNDEEKQFLVNDIEALSGEMEINIEYINNDIYTQSQYFYRSYFENSHLKDYFDDYQLYLSDNDNIKEHLKMLLDETVAYIQEMHEEKRLPLKFSVYGDFSRLSLNEDIIEGAPYQNPTSKINQLDLPNSNIDYLLTIINSQRNKYKLFILNEKDITETIKSLESLNLSYNVYTDELKPGINLCYGYASNGYMVDDISLSVYTATELFKQNKQVGKFANKYAEATALNSYEELNKGDYVVHDQYGIGQYLNIETRTVNGIAMDYLRIIYKGNDELLVPISQFKLVRKYVSKEGVIPKLHKLGSKEWQQTKQKVEENVNEIADRLLTLYSERDNDIGFAFSKDSEMQKEFENDFEYELTKDQAIAINEVKTDMESKKPMDRLLCGDVGFGKTEVALRASFKAINDNKQVAYLCPTTILSLQHFKTFKNRLNKYPCRVELLNRYVSDKDAKEILEDLKQGKVDILIGTHRILSNDVVFKDLGLLIIDEEQRFGVEHKEKIKEVKKSVDVLSLSATPIPRTLQMSLIGIRSLSNIYTPPRNRYPVQTYVVHKNENLIKEVILRELERGGQVFYLFNNVDFIYNVAHKLENEIPYAHIGVAHGKMSSSEMEEEMLKFYEGKIDVLVCTTIMETGVDIPNANTIIIENAQNFGLSQLYQIKGRVGRSDRVAYAYLMVPEKKQLQESSAKRLEAIKEFASLGSGYKIAMRDLTIRGAGDLLGPKQSGFIDNVGLDLYLSMLNKAIKARKGEIVEEEEARKNITIPLESYIPNDFNSNDYEKLTLYHELDKINNKQELLEYYLKIEDEYGKLPKEVEALFEKKRLELLVNLNLIDRITNKNGKFTISLSKEYSNNIDGIKLFEFCSNLSKDIIIAYKNNRLELSAENQKDSMSKILTLVDNLDKLEKENENR